MLETNKPFKPLIRFFSKLVDKHGTFSLLREGDTEGKTWTVTMSIICYYSFVEKKEYCPLDWGKKQVIFNSIPYRKLL